MRWFRRHLPWLAAAALWLGALQALVASVAAASLAGLDPALARDLAVVCSGRGGTEQLPGGPAAPAGHDRLRCFLTCATPLAGAPLAEPAAFPSPPRRMALPAAQSPRGEPLPPPRPALAGLGSRAPPHV